MKQVVLEKYHCMGNDYLVFDPNKNDLELNAENIKKMCSRHFGIGADGILAGPYLGENEFLCTHLQRGRKRGGEERQRHGYFCKISAGRGICAENDNLLENAGRRGDSFLSQRGCGPCENFDGTSDVLE